MNFLVVIFASILFGIFPTIQKFILAAGVTPAAMVVVCNGAAGLMLVGIEWMKKDRFRPSGKQVWAILLFGLAGFGTDYLLDIAYTLLPVGFVTMIHFLYPTFTCAALAVFFHARVTVNKVVTIVLSVAGLVLLAAGSFSGSVLGVLTALGTAVCYASYMIIVEKTPAHDVPPMQRGGWCNLLAAVFSAPLCLQQGTVFPGTGGQWGLCLVVAAMLAAASYFLNLGIQKVGAGTAAFINMVEPVTSLVVSALVLRYDIGAAALAGCVLIVGSLFFTARDASSDERNG